MTGKERLSKIWKWTKRIFLILFISQLVYIVILKWVYPPITMTQFVSWVSGYGLKRDYVKGSFISPNAKLAVIAAEDQLFPDHSGFDWKSIEKARKHNEKKTRKEKRRQYNQSTGCEKCIPLAGWWVFPKGA